MWEHSPKPPRDTVGAVAVVVEIARVVVGMVVGAQVTATRRGGPLAAVQTGLKQEQNAQCKPAEVLARGPARPQSTPKTATILMPQALRLDQLQLQEDNTVWLL